MNRFKLTAVLLFLPFIKSMAVSIESAYTRYYEAGEIRPIRQYFGASLIGQGFRTVIASQPDKPNGQYFIAKLDDVDAGSATSVKMTIFPSVGKDPWKFTLDISGKSLRKWLYLGLTGSDWPDPEIQPMAWKIELLGPDGSLLAEWKSFLWEMPQ